MATYVLPGTSDFGESLTTFRQTSVGFVAGGNRRAARTPDEPIVPAAPKKNRALICPLRYAPRATEVWRV
jgi:hypothetical protein